MSKFTTEVRYICEHFGNDNESAGFSDIDDIIVRAASYIFMPFDIFDENYRLPLEVKILRHYYTREISEETFALWKLRLQDKMNIIMPYYNQLYKSCLLEFNPLYDVNLSRTTHRKDDGSDSRVRSGVDKEKRKYTESEVSQANENNKVKETGESSYDSESTENAGFTKWDLYSDTPQGGVIGINNFETQSESVGDLAYLTNARKNTDASNKGTNSSGDDEYSKENESNRNTNLARNNGGEHSNERNSQTSDIGNITNISDYIETVAGKQGGHTYSQMLIEFRKTFLNIDEMIIEELRPLFFGLWD